MLAQSTVNTETKDLKEKHDLIIQRYNTYYQKWVNKCLEKHTFLQPLKERLLNIKIISSSLKPMDKSVQQKIFSFQCDALLFNLINIEVTVGNKAMSSFGWMFKQSEENRKEAFKQHIADILRSSSNDSSISLVKEELLWEEVEKLLCSFLKWVEQKDLFEDTVSLVKQLEGLEMERPRLEGLSIEKVIEEGNIAILSNGQKIKFSFID